MVKHFLIFIFLVLTGRLFSQNISSEDYQLYSLLIKKETSPTVRSICVFKFALESMREYKNDLKSSLRWEEIKGQGKNSVYLLENQARDSMDDTKAFFDDTLKRFIDKYCEKEPSKFTLQNSFTLPYQVFLLKKLPVKSKSVSENWKLFYEKYPASGGIFAFSNIQYSENKDLAIFYYWVKRNGFNGHGELVVMCKTNDAWQFYFSINLWYN